MIRTTDALILQAKPLRETSRIFVFLTRDYGKLVTLAKGVHREEGRFVSPLDSLTYNRIVFYERPRSGLHLLTQCDLMEGFLPLRGNLEAMACAFYLSELADRTAQPGVREEWLFSLLLESLWELSSGMPSVLLARAFEIKLLAHGGFMPELRLCIVCRRPLTERVSPRFDRGGFVCEACPSPSASWRLSKGTVASLGYLAESDLSRLSRVHLSPEDRDQIEQLLEKFLEFYLEEKPRSRAFLQKVGLS